MTFRPISQREFAIYALSLPTGPDYNPESFDSAWISENDRAVGALLKPEGKGYDYIVMRRQVDHRFVPTAVRNGPSSRESAEAELKAAMRPDGAQEPIPPGVKRRPLLFGPSVKEAGGHFKVLTETIQHRPAFYAVGEVYLAMPRPDDNFVPDFRTNSFDARLWELYLVAAFREQGVYISQDQVSPDFLIERGDDQAYVEAVTANPQGERLQGFTTPVFAPEDRSERLIGAPAVRFAKTLRSKLQRRYEDKPHVKGKPFALAIADFHAPGSMTWSREALPSYLYGTNAVIRQGEAGPIAVGEKIAVLLGDEQIPAGLFRDPALSHVSAVIFSNSATLGKFNRMGFLAGWRPPGLKMIRHGILFDRTPGALEPIPFEHDILSDDYAKLWPSGEAWCQELEVYHNPLTDYPLSFNLAPGATHWLEVDGEVQCLTRWEWSVLASVTHLLFRPEKNDK